MRIYVLVDYENFALIRVEVQYNSCWVRRRTVYSSPLCRYLSCVALIHFGQSLLLSSPFVGPRPGTLCQRLQRAWLMTIDNPLDMLLHVQSESFLVPHA
jgi:hypothetical protein